CARVDYNIWTGQTLDVW
nr:immunoglobulin heavy chain junction region [Macaca mulatta]